ncbi:MAG: hypothetical protein ACC645_05460, partial [Pirellulales bacterium]
LGVYLAVTGIAEFTQQWWAVFPRFIADPTLGMHFGRARGPTLMSASLGVFLAICFWSAWFLWSRVSRGWQLALVGAMGLMGVALYLTYTRSTWLGLAGGLVGLTANFAFVDVASEVHATIGNSSRITVTQDIDLAPKLTVLGYAQGSGTAVGVVAGGAMIADASLGKGNTVDEVVAGVGTSTTVSAKTLRMTPESDDRLFAASVAGAGGLVSGAGASASTSSDLAIVAKVGNAAQINVTNFSILSTHQQEIDSSVDTVSIGLAAATGGFADNEITSKSNVAIGNNAAVTADNITIRATNYLKKEEFDTNLDTTTAGGVNVSILTTDTDIGTGANPFEAVVTIGSGARLTAVGSHASPNLFQIETFTDFDVVDKLDIEGFVLVGGVTAGLLDVRAKTLAEVTASGATLENKTGDVYLTSRSDGNVFASADLFVAGGLSAGVARADVDSVIHNTNRIDITNSTVKGRDLYLRAGQDSFAKPNDQFNFASSQITAASLLPAIVVPTVTAQVIENNVVNVGGTSKLLAFEDVNLTALEGQLGNDRASTAGGAVSISLIPYGMSVPDGSSVTSNNTVTIGNSAKVEAGIHSTAKLLIKPVKLGGVQLLNPNRLGTELTAAEKTALGIPADIAYEYGALDVNAIRFSVRTGNIIKVISGASQGGTAGRYYKYLPQTFSGKYDPQGEPISEAHSLVLQNENYANASRWQDLGVLTQTAIDDYEDAGSPVYDSDVTLQLASGLEDKFYVVKPVEMDGAKISYVNIGNLLFEQRDKLLSWIINHAGDDEALARYQVQLDVLEATMAEYGLLENNGYGTIYKRELDVLFVELPRITAAPGSIFIEAKGAWPATYMPKIGTQLIARPGAEIDIVNESPFTMDVNDVLVRDNRRVTTVGGQYTVLEPGNVYLNNGQLTGVSDTSERTIRIIQDAEPFGQFDLTGLPVAISGIDQDLYINGDVINEAGNVLIDNREGSVIVNGEVRGEQVTILAAKDFTLNSKGWFHTNQDPRQYLDFDAFRQQVYGAGSGSTLVKDDGTFSDGTRTLDAAIARDESKILAQGRIAITARFLNIDGLIQSGGDTIEFDVASTFVPPAHTTNFVGGDGNTLAGISFGGDGVPIDGYWDAGRKAIVLDDIEPDGGEIIVAGQILSTGNGRLKVASGLTSVDINNASPYELILGDIDTTTNRKGKITVVDSGRLTKVEYVVAGNQIQETQFTGTSLPGDKVGDGIDNDGDGDIDDGEIPRIVYTISSGPFNHNFGDPIEYFPESDLHYVWTEGQEKTRVEIRVYEKKSFNLFGEDFLADELAKDNSYKSRKVYNRDERPLLESETREKEGVPPENPLDNPRVPAYANGKAYSIAYELRNDDTVDLIPGTSLVRHPAGDTSGVVYRYKSDAPVADLKLSAIDYASDSNWENSGVDASTFTPNNTTSFESNYVNRTEDLWGPNCTGGGWLRTKTCVTKLTIVTGIKDFYTNTLKADYPIDILFSQGPANPGLSVISKGGIRLLGNVESPENGSITLTSTSGSVTTSSSVAIYGVSPTVIAGGSALLQIEGDKGPLNVTAGGDITVTAISLDNLSSKIVFGNIRSTGGDVFLNAPNGIEPRDGSSLIQGDRIELYSKDSVIGTAAKPVLVNSNLLGTGGLAAKAAGGIDIEETAGDLKLIKPTLLGTAEASVHATAGDVVLEAQAGSILDAYVEQFVPAATFIFDKFPAGRKDFINAGIASGKWTMDSVNYPVSPGLYSFLYPHAEFLGQSQQSFVDETPNVIGQDVTLLATSANADIGLTGDATNVDRPLTYSGLVTAQKQLLSVATASDVVGVTYELFEYLGGAETGVDLTQEDFGSAARWRKISYDMATGTDSSAPLVTTVNTGQIVLVQFNADDYGRYKYKRASGSIDLAGQDYNNTSRWQRIVAQHATDDGSVDLATGQLVNNKFVVETMTLRRVDDVDIELLTSSVTATAYGDIALSTATQMKINRIVAGGDVRLEAGGNITDLYTHGQAAIASTGDLIMGAGGSIRGEDGTSPLRTQLSTASVLQADAAAVIDILQVATDVTINSTFQAISDLFVSKANAGGAVLVEVAQGDMIVGRVSSDTSVDLRAENSILDAFNDSSAPVVNVVTRNTTTPPTGDVYLQAGNDIGTSTNFLDVEINAGELTSLSTNDTFVHSMKSLNVKLVTSTAGDATLDVDGTANIKKMRALAGTATVIADDDIVDIEADAASDIDAIHVKLTSLNSSIGSRYNDLEIDTADTTAGSLWATAPANIYITEVAGRLNVSHAASTTKGHVRLTVSESALSGEDLNLASGNTISTADGSVTLQAGDDMTLAGDLSG